VLCLPLAGEHVLVVHYADGAQRVELRSPGGTALLRILMQPEGPEVHVKGVRVTSL